MIKTLDTLDKIVEENKKDFAKDTLKTILKNWGINFANMPEKERLETLSDILQLANIHLAKDPAGGLAIKIMEQRRRDTDTQERIKYAQSFNLAVQLVSNFEGLKEMKDTDIEQFIEFWQEYFYGKLGDQNGNNN